MFKHKIAILLYLICLGFVKLTAQPDIYLEIDSVRCYGESNGKITVKFNTISKPYDCYLYDKLFPTPVLIESVIGSTDDSVVFEDLIAKPSSYTVFVEDVFDYDIEY